MIEVKIQQVAKSRGIKTSYQLQKLTGWPPGMCSRIWRGDWVHTYIKTLNTLCTVLECTPNDLLEFTADRDEI